MSDKVEAVEQEEDEPFVFVYGKDTLPEEALEKAGKRISAGIRKGWYPYGNAFSFPHTSDDKLAPVHYVVQGMARGLTLQFQGETLTTEEIENGLSAPLATEHAQ